MGIMKSKIENTPISNPQNLQKSAYSFPLLRINISQCEINTILVKYFIVHILNFLLILGHPLCFLNASSYANANGAIKLITHF